MAPFDVPHVTHDMILRFVGMNFSAVLDGSARIPSSLGKLSKPVFVQESKDTPTPVVPPAKGQQGKVTWEGESEYSNLQPKTDCPALRQIPAYYNAGSAAFVLIIIFIIVGIFLIWRHRRRKRFGLPLRTDMEEEAVPLTVRENGEHRD
jgi:carboxypeptidase D